METIMKQRIWDDLLDATRMSRYYDILADKQQRWHLGASVITTVGSVFAATALLYNQFQVSAALFLIVATASSLMVVYDWSRRSQVARSAATQLRETEVELRRLWYRDSCEVAAIEALERRTDSATKDDLRVDHNLNKRCNEEAYRALESFFGPEPQGTS